MKAPLAPNGLHVPSATMPDVPSRSFLDLLHPEGVARRIGALTTSSPEFDDCLRGADGRIVGLDSSGRGTMDAAYLGIDAPRSDDARWVEDAVGKLARSLTENGVGYVAVPRRFRRHVLRALVDNELRVKATYVRVPVGSDASYLVECSAGPIRLLAGSLPARSGKGRAARAALRRFPRVGECLPVAARTTGLAVQRHGARPPFAWASAGFAGHSLPAGLIRLKQRGASRTATLWLFGRATDAPSFVVKSGLDDQGTARVTHEYRNLEQRRPAAVRAGAILPSGQMLGDVFARYACLGGIPADAALAQGNQSASDVVRLVATWIRQWNAGTRALTTVTPGWLDTHLLRPARSVAHLFEPADRYLQWLAAGCSHLAGRTLGLVATHGDLTMSNVLVGDDESLAVVDWESSQDQGLPLSDLYYVAADAHAATRAYRHRGASLIEAFDSRTEYGRFVAQQATLVDPVCVRDRTVLELLLHATALHHAANEHARHPSGPQPFGEFARWLAWRSGALA
jgi:hypothetical protein